MAADSGADIAVVFKAAAIILAVHTADAEGFCAGCGAFGWPVEAADCPQAVWAVRTLDRYQGPAGALSAAAADPGAVFPDGITFPLVGRLATSPSRRAYLFEGQWGTREQQTAWQQRLSRPEALPADQPDTGRRAKTQAGPRVREVGSSAALGRPAGPSAHRPQQSPAPEMPEAGTTSEGKVNEMKVGSWVSACDNSGGSCVEVCDTGAAVMVRDRNGTQVAYDYGEWDTFVAGVRAGVFDRTTR